MAVFKPGVRVGLCDNSEIRTGTIKEIYGQLNIAIVAFDDGDVEKVHVSDLGILPEKKVQEPKEPVEKSEITITPDEFEKVASRVVAEEAKKLGKDGVLFGLALTIVTAKIHGALFIDEGDNA